MSRAPLEMLTGQVTTPAAVGGGARGRGGETRTRRSSRAAARRRAEMLATVGLFSGLNRKHLNELAATAEEVGYRAGEWIVREGLLGETFYVLLEGEAAVKRGGRTIATLRPGDFFGEISILDGGARTADVVAVTDVLAVRVHRRDLVRLLKAEPAVGVRLLAEVSRRLRQRERSVLG